VSPDRVPSGSNVEGAPTLVYEVWDWYYGPEGVHWRFIGYRTLSLRQVLRYQDFGYHVERSAAGDRRDSTPLFPRLDPTGQDARDRVDPVPVPES
jgi:hypothetical protein